MNGNGHQAHNAIVALTAFYSAELAAAAQREQLLMSANALLTEQLARAMQGKGHDPQDQQGPAAVREKG